MSVSKKRVWRHFHFGTACTNWQAGTMVMRWMAFVASMKLLSNMAAYPWAPGPTWQWDKLLVLSQCHLLHWFAFIMALGTITIISIYLQARQLRENWFSFFFFSFPQPTHCLKMPWGSFDKCWIKKKPWLNCQSTYLVIRVKRENCHSDCKSGISIICCNNRVNWLVLNLKYSDNRLFKH